ncbi:MAG TPA: triacylglycerol lipase [Haliangiales bacterium]|nr:triacylglycerol lipase [Haliangiales bacterium]
MLWAGWLAGCAGADPAVVPTDGDPGASVDPAARGAGYTQTRYPIVLAHGASGWKELFGVFEYFYQIPADIRAGGATVYVTSVSAFGSSEARGEQLLAQVEYIVASSGAGKVHLIGHSQGGLDIRYVLAARPDLVASVTTVGTPHQGADLSDWLLAHTAAGGFTRAVIDALGNAFGALLDILAGTDHPQDALGALAQVSSDGMAEFNARYPLGLPASYCGSGPSSSNGVRFYSWGGTSVLTNFLDPTDVPFAIASLFTSGESDGLVGQCSSHFGQVIRDDYGLNHLDEVNQILGATPIFGTDPKALFRAHANRLKSAGL